MAPLPRDTGDTRILSAPPASLSAVSRRPPVPEGPWLVVGMARSGIAAARLLRTLGHEVVGVDAGRPQGMPPDLDVRLGTDGLAELEGANAVVKSPGVPRHAPVIAAAIERGLPVIGELELAWRCLPNPFYAVTGTNGKTTSVELLGAILRVAGSPVAVAGNVGRPLSALVGELPGSAPVVCEASSFQLEDTEAFAPEAAALLNVEPDHLDRHGTFGAYRDAKLRLFAHQTADDVAVLPVGFDDTGVGGAARRVRFGPGGDLDDRAGHLWWNDVPLIAHADLRIRGAHNRANAAAAAALALSRGVSADAVREALQTFPGVEHRLEEVGTVDGVLFINDSKATNVASTLVALRALAEEGEARGVHLILGGQGKAQDFAPLREPASACAGIWLIGEDAPAIERAVGGTVVGDLEHAVAAAGAAAAPGDVVLLSPACASFDQFPDFEARGRRFKELVAERRTSA
ncbi:UDP-N-acetylmuramoyl-L-alanine--D-glutamate ligase [Svornostia abyssi]|uniref:UDP-N-acetylmuramoylalanine--D-glutamate ligase n=1 Tax=Svornostia abyssi TaxID=2898438 RepID=A0ABY5PBX9_9ACTN|nr:UDP-N-acetylmuramoyl-L-alanine--D-glutamate ligase [Parviterribacteraceae bacterium J379]